MFSVKLWFILVNHIAKPIFFSQTLSHFVLSCLTLFIGKDGRFKFLLNRVVFVIFKKIAISQENDVVFVIFSQRM